MVKNRAVIVGFFAILFLMLFARSVSAQTRAYYFGQEWVKIWINPDGSIDLFYNMSLTLESDSDIHYVLIGQPKGDFTIGQASDQDGIALNASDASSGSDYKVQVNLAEPLSAGQTVWFTLTTNVAHMIYEDNQTNVGMEFKPTWFSEAGVVDLRVSIVMPTGVSASMVGTSANYWDGTSVEPDGRLSIYWERQNLPPDQQYNFGVSFPKEYVQHYEQGPSGLTALLLQYAPGLVVLGVLIVVGIVGLARVVGKKQYLHPTMSMETLGVRRGLTAVEASYLLDVKPPNIVTEILYSLLQKRTVWVESTNPSIKLKVMEPFQNKTGTRETPLRYYEIDFLHALKDDGTLDEEKLAKTVMFLRDTVEEKLHGYRRQDTIDYYRSVVTKAWEQVEQAGTPELASKAYDEQLLWLFLDPNVKTRTETAFRDRDFEPSALWLWYWYGYSHYSPHPTYQPNVGTPAQAAKPPTIPGADFANNIATAVEKTSNNIVVDIEKFANSILPFQPSKSSSQPAHHNADCVCACATCACACACVSCACACAGGGAG
jgi:hypothetical protein